MGGVRMLLLFALVVLLHRDVLIVCADSAETPITCDAGTFTVNQSATVICHFPTNVSVSKTDVIVQHFPEGASSDSPGIDVLTCQRDNVSRQFDCDQKDGYAFYGSIHQQLTLHIPTISEQFAGFYQCYTEPQENIDPQLCRLTVEEPNTEIPPSTQETASLQGGGNGQPWLIPVAVLVVVVVVVIVPIVVVVVVVVLCRRRRKRRPSAHPEHECLIWEKDPQFEIQAKQRSQIKELIQGLKPTEADYRQLMEHMAQQMASAFTGNPEGSWMKHFFQVNPFPPETEQGAYLVVELGSSAVRVSEIVLQGQHSDVKSWTTSDIPPELRRGRGSQLFSFVAECVKRFLEDNVTKKISLGLAVSIPCAHQDGLTGATLVDWTKGFHCPDVQGRDLGDLLQEALHETIQPCKLKVEVVLNEAVGTLIAVACKGEASCKAAITLGNGFNACCLLGPNRLQTVEVGALGGSEELERFITDYDREVDRCSVHPGKHVLEKMVAITYVGEIVRLVLRKLIEEGLLFSSAQNTTDIFKEEGSFATGIVSLIESDHSADYQRTRKTLSDLGVRGYTDEDCRVVVEVCQVVLTRAASLAAAGLAALVQYINEQDIAIAVEGSMLRLHENFYHIVRDKACKLVDPRLQFRLKPLFCANAFGTAMVTAAIAGPAKQKKKGSRQRKRSKNRPGKGN